VPGCWSTGCCYTLGIQYLRILTYILAIAAVVQFTEMVIRKVSPELYQVLGIYLPLITTKLCRARSAAAQCAGEKRFAVSLIGGFGSSVGFTLVLVLFAGMRERLALATISATFAGTPIAFITAGLLALAFMGFAGLIPH